MKVFRKDGKYYMLLKKARNHKYLFKKPDGKGGWIYFYKNISVKMEDKFDPQKIFVSYNSVGFEERIGNFKDKTELLISNCNKIESVISNKKDSEYCGIFDESGKISLIKKGTLEGIDFEDDEIVKIKNKKVLTHNHTKDRGISVDDIFLALFLGIEEIRAVYENKIFSFKTSYKEKSKNYFELQYKNKKIIDTISDITKKKQEEIQKLIHNFKITVTESNILEQRQICKNISVNTDLKKFLNMEYKEYEN